MKQIKIGALLSYLAIIVNMIISLLYTPWIIDVLGNSDYGLYTLATSVLSFFIYDFGISSAISRFISLYRAKDDQEAINNFISVTLKMYLSIIVLISIVTVIIYFQLDNIYVELSANELERFKIVYIITGTISLISFPLLPINGIINSYEKFVVLKVLDLVQKISSVVLTFVALSNNFGLYSLVLINGLTQLFFSLIKLAYVFLFLQVKVNFKYKNHRILNKVLKFSSWMFAITVLQRLIVNITPSIIAATFGVIEVPLFSIGQTFDMYLFMIGNALNGLFLPTVTKLSLENDNHLKITNLGIKIGRIQLMIVGLLVGGIIVFGREFIILWIGEDFIASYYIALLLVIPNVFPMTQEILNNYLIAKDEVKYRTLGYAIACVISLGISLTLTPKYGAVGATVGLSAGILAGHVIYMAYIYHKKFEIDMLKFSKEVYIKYISPTIICLSVGSILNHLLPETSWLTLALKVCIYSCVYLASIYFMYMNKNEKQDIISYKNRLTKYL